MTRPAPLLAILVLLAGACAPERAPEPPAEAATDAAGLPSAASSDAPALDAGPVVEDAGAGEETEGASGDAEGAVAAGPGAAPITYPEQAPTFERPEHVRGIYLNAWTAGSSRRTAQLIDLARRTEINTFVIDVKDATGYVSYSTAVPLAREAGAHRQIRIGDIHGLLRRLHEAGIYPIARIVISKDPLLTAARPQLAVQDSAGGPWMDGKDQVWVNPYHREVWDYHLELAREAAELGFPEIQWDYVRFPDAPASEIARARFPGAEGRSKPDAIRAFLAYSREELDALGVETTADVFGVTTSASGDVGIGQVWESFIDVVDVALPMVYPSHYWRGSFGYQRPNAHPYEVVLAALERSQARSRKVPDAGTTRPWLQDFTLGQPRYGAPEVRAQIQATYDAGIQEWILWNPSSRYTAEALAPEGGFAPGADPVIRVAGELVPASRRFAALRAGERAGEVVAPAPIIEIQAPGPVLQADSVIARSRPDSARSPSGPGEPPP